MTSDEAPHRSSDRADRRSRMVAELASSIAAHVDRSNAVIDGIGLFATTATGAPTSSIAEASFAFVAQGAKEVTVGDHVLQYGPGDYLIVSVDLPVTGRFTAASPTAPFLGLRVTLDPTDLAGLVLDAPEPAAGRSGAEPALGTSAAPDELLDALLRLMRLYDEPRDRAVLAPLIKREILWRLLCGPHGELVRAIGVEQSSLAEVARAVRWIRTHYDEAFRVETLAREAAMSTSSFHRHFRAATTMGPIRYQKTVRLQQARMLLHSSMTDVTTVAHRVGYDSPSQFSREYRREFGASPSADVARSA